ncbi:MAG: hypothetical protein WC198_08505 [Victivallaceae bacterium]
MVIRGSSSNENEENNRFTRKQRITWTDHAEGNNMLYEVVGQHTAPCGNILRDEHIRMLAAKTAGAYPEELPHSNLLIHF